MRISNSISTDARNNYNFSCCKCHKLQLDKIAIIHFNILICLMNENVGRGEAAGLRWTIIVTR